MAFKSQVSSTRSGTFSVANLDLAQESDHFSPTPAAEANPEADVNKTPTALSFNKTGKGDP